MGAMFSRRNTFLCVILCAFLSIQLGCGSSRQSTTAKGGAQPEAAASTASGKNQIREFHVQELDNATLVTIEGVREPDFSVFKLNDPLRVVIDLANTEFGDIAGPFAVNNGTVNEITTTQLDDVTSSVARLIIGFDQIVDYEVVPEGPRLKINIQRIGAKPANAQEILVKSSTAPAVAAASTPVPFEAKPGDAEASASPTPPADAGATPGSATESVAATEGGPRAGQIVDVKIEKLEAGSLKVTLAADGKIGDFTATPIEKPARLVVDFPGLTSGYAKKKLKAPAPLKEIRLGAHSDKLRIVMDSKNGKKLPAYTTENLGDHVVVTVGKAAEGLTPAPEVAAAPGAETPAVAPGETPAETAPAEAAPTEPAKPTGPIVKVGSLDFKQLPKASRLAIKVPETVSYQTLPYTNGKVVIELVGAKLPKPLQRALDTSEFDSPVTLIKAYNPKGQNGVVRVEVALREDVPVNANREEGTLNFDFERTKVFVAAATAPEVKTEALAAAPSGKSALEPLAAEEPAAGAPVEEGAAAAPAAGAASKSSAGEFGGSGMLSGGSSGGGNDDMLGLGPLPIVDTEGGTTGASSQRFSGRRISLDFKDADIKNIFRLIAEISKLNIIVGDSVGGTITLRLINVPWDQALAIILQSKKLGIVRYDNILRIAPLSELEQERKAALSAKEAERDLEDLRVVYIEVNYTKASDLMQKVTPLLSKRGKVSTDVRTNTLIVTDIPEMLRQVRSMVATLDRQTRQVIIDGRIVEAKRNWERSLGINWGGSYIASAATGNPTGLDFPSAVGIGGGRSFATGTSNGILEPPGTAGLGPKNYVVNLPAKGEVGALGISLGQLAGIGDLDIRLGALEHEDRVRIVSSPRVATQENEAATIQSGTQIPYATVSSAGTSTTFVNAVLSLSVTPHVTNNNRVQMDLAVTNNSPGANTAAGPQINVSSTTTKVMVKDGDTMVLGGVYVLTTQFNQDGLPWLRTIPGINLLFANYDKTDGRSELLFFITPRIVTDAMAAK